MELKRYVRTEDGRLFDTSVETIIENILYPRNEEVFLKCVNVKKEIANTSDNIEDLIEVGDLVEVNVDGNLLPVYNGKGFIYENEEKDERVIMDKLGIIHAISNRKNINILSIYTKQGDNYILVARKNEKGWEVL